PETGRPIGRPPRPMTAVAAVLLAGSLAVGTVPALARGVAVAAEAFTDHAGYAAAVLDGRPVPEPVPHAGEWWSWSGVLLGLLSGALAVALAARAVHRPVPALRWAAPLRRLHSGHVGDYVAWAMAGIGLLSALTLW
ncbi:NADH-quinone oxidoreductase subunit D, partial [Streptomyces sp. NPDC049577]